MRPRPSSVALALAAFLAGCEHLPAKEWALLPAGALLLSDATLLKAPVAAAGLAFYVVSDPFAPNWVIEEARQSDERYLLALRHKAVHSGGGGEARQVFARRAAQLAGQPGFGAYEVVNWQTGIDSGRPFAQRVAYGEVRLVRLQPPRDVANSAP